MGGLRGPTNLASWAVASTLAYFLWVKPSQDLKRDQQVFFQFLSFPFNFSTVYYINGDLQERAALEPDRYRHRYVEKRKPIPDPQVLFFTFTQYHSLLCFFLLQIQIATIFNFQDNGLIYGKKSVTDANKD